MVKTDASLCAFSLLLWSWLFLFFFLFVCFCSSSEHSMIRTLDWSLCDASIFNRYIFKHAVTMWQSTSFNSEIILFWTFECLNEFPRQFGTPVVPTEMNSRALVRSLLTEIPMRAMENSARLATSSRGPTGQNTRFLFVCYYYFDHSVYFFQQ